MIKIIKESFFPFSTQRECKTFFRNVFLMCCILINVNVVRIIKDSYVTTMLGAETISFCKLLGELPFSILFFFLYSKLSNIMNTEKLCRYTICVFLAFLTLLPLLFFEFHSVVTLPESTANSIIAAYPFLKWIIITFGNWPYVLYFVLGEVWPVIAYSVLFWQFINKFNKPEEGAKHYISYNLYGQSSLLVSGLIVNYFILNKTYLGDFVELFLSPVNDSDLKVKILSIIVLFLGVTAVIVHYACEFHYKKIGANIAIKDKKQDKFHLTIKESIIILAKSQKIRNIVLIIFGYGFTVTLMHLTWLSALQHQYPSPVEFMKFQAMLNYWTGLLTIIFAVFGKRIVDIFGLPFSANLTPIVTLIPGVIFYLLCTFYSYSMNTIVMAYATLIGSIQYVLVRASKYALFDSTKERLYTYVESDELKTKGKVIADVIGFKLGKAMGSLVLAVPLMILPNLDYITSAPFTMICFAVVCILWIKSILQSTKKT